MSANALCSLPNVDIDEDEDPVVRGKAYLRSVLREVRDASGRAPSAVWQLTFDVVNLRHAHGQMLVVSSDVTETRMWGLTQTPAQARAFGSRYAKPGPPRPEPGQFVARVGAGFTTLTEDDLHSMAAEIMAQRLLTG